MQGTVHKRRPQSGDLYNADKGGYSDANVRLLVQKTSDFSKFIVCPHGQRGLSHCRQGEGGGGQFFAILCWRLLWTAPNDA